MIPPFCQHLAILCTGEPDRVVRLDGVKDPVALCRPCIDYTTRQGMNPVPVPTWLGRGMTGENRIKDMTGAAIVRGVA